MNDPLYLHSVAPKEQGMLPLARTLAQAVNASGLNKLLDEWQQTDRILCLPRTMAMEICEKKIDPRRAKPILDVFERLLSMGVSVDDTVKQRRLLHAACECGNIALVQFLLSNGADTNARSSLRAETSLHAAAMRGHGAVCEALLAHGADLGAHDSYANSPLMRTCLHENTLPAMQVLLRHGAPVDDRLPDGRTLLHVLVANALAWKRKGGADFREAVLALVSHGVDVEAVDHQGQGLERVMCYVGSDIRQTVHGLVHQGQAMFQARLIEKATTPTTAPRSRSSRI